MEESPCLADLDATGTISVPEAGKILGVGRDAAYEAARRGDIPTIKVGPKLLRVPVGVLMRMLGR